MRSLTVSSHATPCLGRASLTSEKLLYIKYEANYSRQLCRRGDPLVTIRSYSAPVEAPKIRPRLSVGLPEPSLVEI